MKKKKFYQQKTFWAACALMATNLLPLVGATAATIHMVQVSIGALTAIFMRQGLENSKML